MAYVFAVIQNQSDAGATDVDFSPSNPVHAVGDLLLHIINNDNGGTTITESGGGWTELSTQSTQSANRGAIFYRIATVANTNDPTFLGSGDGWAVTSMTIRDMKVGSTILVSRGDIAGPTNLATCPTITTPSDNCLVLRAVSGWDLSGSYSYTTGDRKNLGLSYDLASVTVAVKNQITAGATGTFDFQQARSDGGNTYTISIENKTNGGLEPNFVNALTFISRAFGQFGSTGIESQPTFTPLYSSVTSVGGIAVSSATVNDFAITDVPNTGIINSGTRVRLSDGTNNQWHGVTYPITPVDLTGKSILANTGTTISAIGGLGRLFMVFDGSGNWKAYISPKSEGKLSSNAYPIWFDNSTVPIDSSGTLNWANIVKIGIAMHKVGSSTGSRGPIALNSASVGTYVFSGCNIARPLTPSVLVPYLEQNGIIGIANLQGSGQVLSRASVQIGDGTNTTYFKGEANSFELPAEYGKGQNNWALSDNNVNLIIKASASDVMDLSASIWATSNAQNFTIDPASSTSATYDFNGSTIKGWRVTWKTGVDCIGASFLSCNTIDGKGAHFANVTVKNSRATGASALKIDTGASVINSSFTKKDEAYAIEIQSAGTYDLEGTVFSGYTTDINVSAASGTVTINLEFGQAVPTYTTAGATVVISLPQSVASITGIQSGSTIRIYNETADVEITTEILAGTSYTANYDDGTDYTAGDIVRVDINCLDCFEFRQRAIVSLAGWSILASQETNPYYALTGYDGTAVIKFSADYINNEADLNVASNFDMAEFYAWWCYNRTTVQGIRNFFGAIRAIDQANLINDTDILPMKFDNLTSTSVHQLDNIRFFRKDGVYPVKEPTTGGGGIDIVWRNQIFIAETGTSGLTAGESAQLNAINTISSRLNGLVEDVSGDRFTTKALETAGGGSAPTAEDIRIEMETSTVLAKEATVTARPTLTQVEGSTVLAKEATSTSIKAKTDLLSFTGTDVKATLDGEEVVTDIASRNASKATGFATPTNVSDAQTAITSAISALNDFDPINDVVAHVTLVDTTTTNTDMRGTNGAITSLLGIATSTNVTDAQTAIIAEIDANETKIDTLTTNLAGKPTLAQIEASTVIAKESTVNSKASQISVDGKPTLAQIEGSTVLAKESTNIAIKGKTDQLDFVNGDVKSTLDGEITLAIKL